ncbi:hypothetical protein [Saccharopolyspora sp. CA-218241]|uniref:hypothetical protein n=1 Tax=Saccharopolyspora sp. CA-218241 TaxID=3240027 RepID=UPI003D989A64
MVIVFVRMATMLGSVVVLPLHFQTGLGVSTLTTGLLLLPGGLVQGVPSPLIGRIHDQVGPRPLVVPGALLLAGGQWWLSTAGAGTGLGAVVAMHVVFCTGMAMLMALPPAPATSAQAPRWASSRSLRNLPSGSNSATSAAKSDQRG